MIIRKLWSLSSTSMVRKKARQSIWRLMKMMKLRCWWSVSLMKHQHLVHSLEGALHWSFFDSGAWTSFLNESLVHGSQEEYFITWNVCSLMAAHFHAHSLINSIITRSSVALIVIKCYMVIWLLFLTNKHISICSWQCISDGVMKFEAMPLSAKTRYSLKVAKLEIATEIQAAAIPHALAGRYVFR